MASRAPKQCPVCGSRNWKNVGTDASGFSVGKAAVGTVLFGAIGLVGGALGKKKTTFYCRDCCFHNDYKPQ